VPVFWVKSPGAVAVPAVVFQSMVTLVGETDERVTGTLIWRHPPSPSATVRSFTFSPGGASSRIETTAVPSAMVAPEAPASWTLKVSTGSSSGSATVFRTMVFDCSPLAKARLPAAAT
jgi:hypothetical protein